jgi:hypothetical protein
MPLPARPGHIQNLDSGIGLPKGLTQDNLGNPIDNATINLMVV